LPHDSLRLNAPSCSAPVGNPRRSPQISAYSQRILSPLSRIAGSYFGYRRSTGHGRGHVDGGTEWIEVPGSGQDTSLPSIPTYGGEGHEVSGTSPIQGDDGSTSPCRELSKPRCAWAICSGWGRPPCRPVNRACRAPRRQGGEPDSGNRHLPVWDGAQEGGRTDARFGHLMAGV
jgi:hypothetical protein